MLIGPTLRFRRGVSSHLFVSWLPLKIVLCAEGCSACELHRGMGRPPSQPSSSVSLCNLSVCLSQFLLVCLPGPLARAALRSMCLLARSFRVLIPWLGLLSSP